MVVVIGAGFWGSTIARFLRESHLRVTLIDDGDPQAGSRNAAGVMSPDVYQSDKVQSLLPKDWTRDELAESMAWARIVGKGETNRGNFLNGMNGDIHSRPAAETPNVYFPPGAFLDPDYLRARVTALTQTLGGWVVEIPGQKTLADHVVVAAGYRTDEVLKLAGIRPLGVTGLFGRGVVGTGLLRHPLPLYVMTRPYTKVGVRTWGSMFYVGATSEKTPKDKNEADLLDFANKYIEGFQPVTWMRGYRPVLPQFTVAEVAPRLIAATGGNRFGIGLAALVAERVRRMVE